ncbi:unnamed protein product [Clonostachys rhizophaga]|uniref:Uncharacterized protein n=1 Tax=Clonostachys rhizophaga TaxID=160324 RepID=A0A9N9VH53_9HYPO|nr:unnamed protein product [Clonostachys rhizophaga]
MGKPQTIAKPEHTQTPLNMCSRMEWRFMTFYRSLTPATLQTAQTIAAPFEEDEQEAAVSEEDLEEDE